MKPRSVLSVTAPVALLLLSTTNALSLFGFGSSDNSAEDAKARAAAVALINENAAADEFIPPAAGVGRRDAARFVAAREGGKLVCSGDSAHTEIAWDRVNDDFCDCPGDGSDEPGTSACSNGTLRLRCFIDIDRYALFQRRVVWRTDQVAPQVGCERYVLLAHEDGIGAFGRHRASLYYAVCFHSAG